MVPEEQSFSFSFCRLRGGGSSRHLFVANCGPVLGISLPAIRRAFESSFGPVAEVQPADKSGTRVLVSFSSPVHAQACFQAWNGAPCPPLANRILHIQFSQRRTILPKVENTFKVNRTDEEIGIPGLYLYTDFVTKEEEQVLLTAVDERPWQHLSRRRVQHYGYEFKYKIRNVDTDEKLGKLPEFTDFVLKRLSTTAVSESKNKDGSFLSFDQLTVNEYPPGVGLSPHVDTHSAFETVIISLSLAGPCIMEFRKYDTDESTIKHDRLDEDGIGISHCSKTEEHSLGDETSTNVEAVSNEHSTSKKRLSDRKAIFLPPRSLLVLSNEARYGWFHYIPHHKVDLIDGQVLQRHRRRVSLTFRKVQNGPCNCEFTSYCDSQMSKSEADMKGSVERHDGDGDANNGLKVSPILDETNGHSQEQDSSSNQL